MKGFSDMFDENLVDSQVQVKSKIPRDHDQEVDKNMIGDKREREREISIIKNN
jgi:hypothetical protein